MVSQLRLELVEIDFAHGADDIVLFFNVVRFKREREREE